MKKTQPISSSFPKFVACILLITAIISGFIAYSRSNDDLLKKTLNSGSYLAFKSDSDRAKILIALCCSVASSVPMVLDEILDYLCDSSRRVGFDRAFSFILILIPSIIVIGNLNSDFAHLIIAAVHSYQYVGAFGLLLTRCHRKAPAYFTAIRCIYLQLIFSFAGINAIVGFGESLVHWANILTFFLVFGTVFPFFYLIYLWFSEHFDKNRTNDKMLCWYLSCFTLFVLVFPGITASIFLFSWADFDVNVISIFICGFSVFLLLYNSLPGRLIGLKYRRLQKVALNTKTQLIRYLSHEIRSPLNIIVAAAEFLDDDVRQSVKNMEQDMVSSILENTV